MMAGSAFSFPMTSPKSYAENASPPLPGKVRRILFKDRIEKPVEWLIRICGWSSIICVVAIFLFVIKEAGPMMWTLDWKVFLTSDRWIPNPAGDNAPSFGALALIVGTFSTTFLAMLFAVPFGLAAAVYISEFAEGRVKEILKIVIELLAAIPSIVWGFIGLMVMGPIIKDFTGAEQGTNLLNGSIILGLMSVPLIVSLSEDALRAVPDTYREAAMALGANKWETIYRVLFPAARNGLLAAVMLGMGRAIGETMAVLMATGHSAQIPHLLTDPIRTMTATIAAELAETVQGGDHYRVLFVIGVVLFVITCTINVVSDLVVKGIKTTNKS